MTREEAKEFLTSISWKLGNMSIEYLSEKDGDKMREAIEVLEQEPCEDCISRQAVLVGLARIAKAKAKSEPQKAMMGRAMFFVEHLPFVAPVTENEKFLEFLMNTINPNEMEQYLAMYHSKGEKTNG